MEDLQRDYYEWTIDNYYKIVKLGDRFSPTFCLKGHPCQLLLKWYGSNAGRIGLYAKNASQQLVKNIKVTLSCYHRNGIDNQTFVVELLNEFMGIPDFLEGPKLKEFIINNTITFICKLHV